MSYSKMRYVDKRKRAACAVLAHANCLCATLLHSAYRENGADAGLTVGDTKVSWIFTNVKNNEGGIYRYILGGLIL